MFYSKHWDYSEEDLVLLYLKGVCAVNPSLTLNEDTKIIFNAKSASDKVIVISGGGSGHEPTHAGFVGEGLLDVAIAGNIFASPSAKQTLNGLRSIKSEKGYLLIVKNYTGDILNFGLAAERAKSLGMTLN
jgi:dihydroxyacetone kinase